MTGIFRWIIHHVPVRFVTHRSTYVSRYGPTLDVYPAAELRAKLAATQAKLRAR